MEAANINVMKIAHKRTFHLVGFAMQAYLDDNYLFKAFVYVIIE